MCVGYSNSRIFNMFFRVFSCKFVIFDTFKRYEYGSKNHQTTHAMPESGLRVYVFMCTFV